MGSVTNELWHIFTYYGLLGNSLDPEHIKVHLPEHPAEQIVGMTMVGDGLSQPAQFVRFARDCQMLSSWSVSDIHVAISKQVLVNVVVGLR